MKSRKITYCVAEDEPIPVFAASVAALSRDGREIIAKFNTTVLYISPHSTQSEILNLFEYADYNSSAMLLIGNL